MGNIIFEYTVNSFNDLKKFLQWIEDNTDIIWASLQDPTDVIKVSSLINDYMKTGGLITIHFAQDTDLDLMTMTWFPTSKEAIISVDEMIKNFPRKYLKKQKEDSHTGMIYNPYTNKWSYL